MFWHLIRIKSLESDYYVWQLALCNLPISITSCVFSVVLAMAGLLRGGRIRQRSNGLNLNWWLDRDAAKLVGV